MCLWYWLIWVVPKKSCKTDMLLYVTVNCKTKYILYSTDMQQKNFSSVPW